MAKLPNPDVVRLGRLAPPIRVLGAGTRLFRIYFQAGKHPARWNEFRAYGPTSNRFDHHVPPPGIQARRILYAAVDAATCYAEVFQSSRNINVTRRRPHLVSFRTVRSLQLLDLTGPWVTQAGASMAISAGSRRQARLWSKAFYETYPTVEGLWYGSSMYGNRPAIALYERAEDALPSTSDMDRPLKHPRLLAAVRGVALKLGYGVTGL